MSSSNLLASSFPALPSLQDKAGQAHRQLQDQVLKSLNETSAACVSINVAPKVAPQFGQERTEKISLCPQLDVLGKNSKIQPLLHKCNNILLLIIIIISQEF